MKIAQDEELDPQDLSSNEVVSGTNEATEGGISDADSIPLDGGGTAENADEAPSGEEALWNQGKVLFQGKCASCHHPIRDGTGPALSGVRQRWIDDGDFQDKSGEEWLYEWIRNNKSVLLFAQNKDKLLFL